MAADTLEFAINMELDGREYYQKQAALHSGDSLKAVFDMLAGEEGAHAELLTGKRDGFKPRLDAPERPSLRSVFEGADDIKSDIADVPEQLDAYRSALEKERHSADIYRKLLAEDEGGGELYRFLIQQEEEHYEILEAIVKLVERPKSWVESAEFGLREEY